MRLWVFSKIYFSVFTFFVLWACITFSALKMKPEFREGDLRWHSGTCHLLLMKFKIGFQSYVRGNRKNTSVRHTKNHIYVLIRLIPVMFQLNLNPQMSFCFQLLSISWLTMFIMGLLCARLWVMLDKLWSKANLVFTLLQLMVTQVFSNPRYKSQQTNLMYLDIYKFTGAIL